MQRPVPIYLVHLQSAGGTTAEVHIHGAETDEQACRFAQEHMQEGPLGRDCGWLPLRVLRLT